MGAWMRATFFARQVNRNRNIFRNQFGGSLGGTIKSDRTVFSMTTKARVRAKAFPELPKCPHSGTRRQLSQSLFGAPTNLSSSLFRASYSFDAHQQRGPGHRAPLSWQNRNVLFQNFVASPKKTRPQRRFRRERDHRIAAEGDLTCRYASRSRSIRALYRSVCSLVPDRRYREATEPENAMAAFTRLYHRSW